MGLHFDLSSEQRMLATSTRGLLARLPKAGSGAFGTALAEHGVFGLMAPEAAGGLGLGLVDALAVATETGRAQTPFPVIETIAAASLVSRVRPDAALEVLNGAAIATCATGGEAESDGPNDSARLRGTLFAAFADRARWLAVPVKHAGRNDPGPWATIIDLTGPGVSIASAPALDLTYPMFRVELDADAAPPAILEHELQSMLAVLAAAELTGAAEHCLDATVRYLKERVQFGKPIGANQALRHVVADDWVRVQGMRAASEYAAAAFDASHGARGNGLPPQAFRHAAHVAKAYCSSAAREVAEHAIHLHGGIGFTWEFGLHVPLRRILRLASSLGTAADHLDALAAEMPRRDKSGNAA
jgi:alkylation response protein AidB-like acyl-CoA dehydrogenase